MFWKFTLFMQRRRMIAYAVLVAAITVLSTLPVTMLWKDEHWQFVHATDPRAIALFWQQATANVIAALTIVLVFCAGDLGVTALGDDAEQRSLEWVATRPRSRTGLAWAAWAASACNALLLVAVGTLVYTIVLLLSTSTVDFSSVVHTIVALAALSLAMLSVAYFFSVGTGSARNGYLLALFILVFGAVARYAYFSIVLKSYVPLWFFSSNNLYQPRINGTIAAVTLAAAALLSFGGATIFARRDL